MKKEITKKELTEFIMQKVKRADPQVQRIFRSSLAKELKRI
jgi:hypothetical protein